MWASKVREPWRAHSNPTAITRLAAVLESGTQLTVFLADADRAVWHVVAQSNKHELEVVFLFEKMRSGSSEHRFESFLAFRCAPTKDPCGPREEKQSFYCVPGAGHWCSRRVGLVTIPSVGKAAPTPRKSAARETRSLRRSHAREEGPIPASAVQPGG